MKVLSFFLLMNLLICHVSGQTDAQNYEAVAQTLNYYLEGGTNNDFQTLKKAFHPSATMVSLRDGAPQQVNALDFFEKGIKPGPPQERMTKIVSIAITGDAAFAQLTIEYPTFTFTDYMSLLRIEGAWKIVNKMFVKTE